MGHTISKSKQRSETHRGRRVTRRRTAAAMVAATAGLVASRAATAATLTWDPQGTGSGSDVSLYSWYTDQTMPPEFDSPTGGLVVWDNTANMGDTALFGAGGTGSYTVNLATNIVAGGLLFNTGNYTIAPGAGYGLSLTTGTGLTVAAGTSAIPVTGTVSAPITVSADQTWTVGAYGTLSVSNTVTGSVALTKTGAGTLSLGGTTSFTSVNVAAGTLAAVIPGALGMGTVTLGGTTATAATLRAASTSAFTLPNAITLGAPTAATNYTITKDATNGSSGTAITLSGNITGGNTTGTSFATLLLNTSVSGDFTTSFRLSGVNTFTGRVFVNRGRLQVGASTDLGASTNPVVLDAVNSGTSGNLEFVNPLTLTNPIALGDNNAQTINTNANAVTLSGNLTTYSDSTSTPLNKIGTGVLTLTGTNAYVGGTTITGGTIAYNNGSAFGAGNISAGSAAGSTSVTNTTPFILSVTSPTAATTTTLTNNIIVPSPTSAFVYPISQTGVASTNAVNASTAVFSGVISGGGPNATLELNSAIVGDYASTIAFNGSNTLAGRVYLNRGSLSIGNANALGTASLTMDGYTSSVLSFTVPVTLTNTITNSTAYSINTKTNAVTLSGVISGTTGFTLAGTGSSLTLGGANTYAGTTILNAGTLTTNATGSLGVGNVSVGAATLTLGNGTSIADTATLTVNSSGGSVVNLNAAGGTETVAALFNLATNTTFNTPGTYATSTLDSSDGFGSVFANTNGETLTISAAPEPTSLLLASFAVAPLLGRRRRRAAAAM